MLEVTVSMPPSTNHLFRNVRGKGRVRTDKYKAWQTENLWALKTQPTEAIEGPVRAEYFLPSTSRMDIDNACKPLGDILEKSGILANDRQIRELWIEHEDRADVLVRVTPITKERGR